MFNVKSLVLAVSFASATFAANAAEYAATFTVPNQLQYENAAPEASFQDWVSFSAVPGGSLFATISGTSSTSFALTNFDLYDGSKNFIASGVYNNLTATASVGYIIDSVASGNYYLYVAGNTNGGSYNGNISISAVPEPESYAMMLAGLGLIGFAARRRS